MKTTHTPGPWRLDSGVMTSAGLTVIGTMEGEGFPLAVVKHAPTPGYFKSAGMANAALIAAAPDLLAALQMAVRSRWLSIDFDGNRTTEACAIRSAMCAAIDKAEGTAS